MTSRPGPRVSVVIPTHNRAAMTCEAVETTLEQSYAPVEVLVVDDGSEDDTAEQMAAFGLRIVVLRQARQGPGGARNSGIRAARGAWIAFLDSDDLWTPDHLERLVDTLQAYPELAWACSGSRTQGENANQNECRGKKAQKFGVGTRGQVFGDFFFAAGRGFHFCTSGFVIRRDLLISVGGFDEQLAHGEDLDLWWRIARLYPSIGYDPCPTVVCRQIAGNQLTKKHWSIDHDVCAMIERHFVCLASTSQEASFQRVAARILDLYASRAVHSGDVDGLLELDRRFRRLLRLRRRLTARVLRFLPGSAQRALLVLGRIPGVLRASLPGRRV